MTTMLLTRRYLAAYARRPLNLALLVVVPVLFVALAASAITEFAAILGGIDDTASLAAPTAGWAAAFLAGVAGYFLVEGSWRPDRRLAAAGMGPLRIVTARLTAGLALAALATVVAFGTLAIRTEVAHPLRILVGTAIFATTYLALGVAVGAVVKNPLNGSLVVVFLWMFDVFLGPGMVGGDMPATRLFPTHFPTFLLLGRPSGHAGPLGDLGWSLLWTVGGLAVSASLFAATTRTGDRRRPRRLAGVRQRILAAFTYGFREYRRNLTMWVLLVLLPVLFISLSFAVTPEEPAPVALVEGGRSTIRILSMADVHGALMVPITVAFIAGLAGMFVVVSSLEADRRLALAGIRPAEILTARLGVIGLAALLTAAVSLAVTAFDFLPAQWGPFALSSVIVAFTYGMIGVLVGALFGRLGGLYVMFLLPMIDVGIAQNVMFSAAPPDWGRFLPARGSVQLLVDGAFTPTLDRGDALLLALAWLVGITLVAGLVFHRIAAPEQA